MSSKAKIYLYKEGNECNAITGGWYNQTTSGGSSSTFTFQKNVGNINFDVNSTNAHRNTIYTKNGINGNIFSSFFVDSIDTYAIQISAYKNSSDFGVASNRIKYTQTNDGYNTRFVKKLDVSEITNNPTFFVYSIVNPDTSKISSTVYNVYLETEENVISINSQNTSSVNFSCNTFDNLITITKAEVYINNQLSKSYTSNFDNLTYNIDNSLISIGDNKISIKVTYTQGDEIFETVEEVLTHTNTVNNLPTSSSLKELIDKQELINEGLGYQIDLFRNKLISKNVEVSEDENRLSVLIDKVDSLGNYDNGKLWLYKDGDECTNITGGWDDLLLRNQGGTITRTRTNGALSVTANINVLYPTSGGFATKNIINLQEYNKLYFMYSHSRNTENYTSHHILGTIKDKSTNNNEQTDKFSARITAKKGDNIIDYIDISNISSSAIAFVTGHNQTNSNITVYRVWLEK